MPKIVRVYGYDDSVTEYAVYDSWPGPTVTFLRGFVEIEEGVFLNANDIKRIEIVEEE
jgi:hypothetical protein